MVHIAEFPVRIVIVCMICLRRVNIIFEHQQQCWSRVHKAIRLRGWRLLYHCHRIIIIIIIIIVVIIVVVFTRAHKAIRVGGWR